MWEDVEGQPIVRFVERLSPGLKSVGVRSGKEVLINCLIRALSLNGMYKGVCVLFVIFYLKI